jgi:hypothetical protein
MDWGLRAKRRLTWPISPGESPREVKAHGRLAGAPPARRRLRSGLVGACSPSRAAFLKDYVAESNDAATATEQAFRECLQWRGGRAGRVHRFRQAGLPHSRRQHPCRPRAHDGAPDGYGSARRCSAERVRRRRSVRAVPRGWDRRRAAARHAQCRCRGIRARAAVSSGRLRRLRPPARRGPDHRAVRGADRASERVVREEKSAREQRPITVAVNVTAADASSFRASQGQVAADMARAIDRASRNR